MTALYNEYCPKKAAWLRELIRRGVIAPGVVDERSILDIRPSELCGYTQVHLCAGIGVWSYALRAAGWGDHEPVWTVSEPCQPHSAAGKMLGDADERYLRWAIHHHIQHGKRPDVPVLGEQIANGDGLSWLDTLSADMESADHSVWSFDLCSAGLGSANIRQRLYWLAYSKSLDGGARFQHGSTWRRGGEHGYCGDVRRVANANDPERRADCARGNDRRGNAPRWAKITSDAESCSGLCRLANTNGGNTSSEREQCGREYGQQPQNGGVGHMGDTEGRGWGECWDASQQGSGGHADSASDVSGGMANTGSRGGAPRLSEPHEWESGNSRIHDNRSGGQFGQPAAPPTARPGPVNGFWRNADWLSCRDGKWRPVRPGSFPLVTGAPARVLRLRGYGDAINAEVATAWARVVRECLA